MFSLLGTVLLAAALSLDSFAAGFVYGTEKIRIPALSVLVLSGACTGVLGLSSLLGVLLRNVLPPSLPKLTGFLLLFFLGLCKLADPQRADADKNKILSPRESLPLALALSLDGAAAGLGGALGDSNMALAVALTLPANAAAIFAGSRLGSRARSAVPLNLSWLGGALLIVLALSRLF